MTAQIIVGRNEKLSLVERKPRMDRQNTKNIVVNPYKLNKRTNASSVYTRI